MDTSIRIGDVVGKVDQELCKASFRSRIVTKDRRECGIAERFRKTLSKCLSGTSVIAQSKDNINAHAQAIRCMILPKEATHNVLQKPCSLLLNQLGNHITEHSANSIKSLICSTYVVETMVV